MGRHPLPPSPQKYPNLSFGINTADVGAALMLGLAWAPSSPTSSCSKAWLWSWVDTGAQVFRPGACIAPSQAPRSGSLSPGTSQGLLAPLGHRQSPLEFLKTLQARRISLWTFSWEMTTLLPPCPDSTPITNCSEKATEEMGRSSTYGALGQLSRPQ